MIANKIKLRRLLHKSEIIDTAAQKLGITKKESKDLFDTILEFIKKKLQKGYRVQLSPFGIFSIKSNKLQSANNKSICSKPANKNTKIVIFKPGKELEKRG